MTAHDPEPADRRSALRMDAAFRVNAAILRLWSLAQMRPGGRDQNGAGSRVSRGSPPAPVCDRLSKRVYRALY